MIKTVMKNWGFFLIELEEMYEEFKKQREQELDPYKQLGLDEKMTIINNCMRTYKEYIKRIKDDNGKEFAQYLNNNLLDVYRKSKTAKQDYMKVIHFESLALFNKLTKRFGEFITEQR